MDFPAYPPTEAREPDGLSAALGVPLVSVHRSRSNLLVELADEKTVRTLKPDMQKLAALDASGVIVTAPAIADRIDFVSRYFAPRKGIPEDPVTGSAHCVLGPFWGARLGKQSLLGYQVSDRGGTVRVALAGDRVMLGGQAVTVMRGTLTA
jgi:PhzF family phenazine biosynthesis protein